MKPVTEEDVGAPVVDADDGRQIGVVARVDGETVYVDPDPDVADDARSTLGWGDLEDVTYPVAAAAFDRVEDDGPTLLLDLATVGNR